MKIAQVSTPHLPTPPDGYGASELIASLVTEELVRRGHEVTLFAHGLSSTAARLVSFPETEATDRFEHREIIHVGLAMERARDFDIVHNHCLFAGPAVLRFPPVPALTTLHYVHPVLAGFRDHPYVAISRTQAASHRELNVVGVVHNAVDLKQFRPARAREDYLLFLGRFHPNKGADLAIQVAKMVGAKLVIAAPLPHQDQQSYFDECVRPHLGGGVEYLGEVAGKRKSELLSRARCVLLPNRWQEPFGLVMLEAAASGTPVVAMGGGAVPELVVHGKTGYVADDVDGMVEAVRQVDSIEPSCCREHAEANFSVEKMVDGYLSIYERMLRGEGLLTSLAA